MKNRLQNEYDQSGFCLETISNKVFWLDDLRQQEVYSPMKSVNQKAIHVKA